jgi:4-amino-4-deoxy-L-arabinose transferase-like glycosyltransferase
VRLAWLHFGPRIIESEGCNYARIGENIAAGRGMVGLHELGLQLIYPPLYSGLIAGGVSLGISSELAGRLISLTFGACLPLIVAWLARRIYGQTPGWLAGIVASLHPILIATSVAVLSESTYLALSTLAICFVVAGLQLSSLRHAIAAGTVLGLAYLCRPEAMALVALFVAITFLLNYRRWRRALRHCGLMLGAFALFATPYVAFLYHETGQVRFEAKTGDHIKYALAVQSGKSWGELYYGINDDLTEYGSVNTSDLQQMHEEGHVPASRVAGILAHDVARNLPNFLREALSLEFGEPVFGLLIVLGIFAAPWDRDRMRNELPSCAVLCLSSLAFLAMPFLRDRFLFPILPPLTAWGGLGLHRLMEFARSTSANLNLDHWKPRVDAATLAGTMLSLCVTSIIGVRRSDDLCSAWSDLQYDKPVGLWLQSHYGARRRIMDTDPTVAYYSASVLIGYPWADSPTALRYIDHKNVDFLVLRDFDRDRRPYFSNWLARIPDQFEPIAIFPAPSGSIRVYSWKGE